MNISLVLSYCDPFWAINFDLPEVHEVYKSKLFLVLVEKCTLDLFNLIVILPVGGGAFSGMNVSKINIKLIIM
jgi:hypothetical protein